MCHAHLTDVMTDCSLCRLPDYRTANTSNTIARERYALYQIARTIEIPAKISHNYMSTKNPELNTHNCAILFRHTGQCAVLKTAVTHRQARLVITPHRQGSGQLQCALPYKVQHWTRQRSNAISLSVCLSASIFLQPLDRSSRNLVYRSRVAVDGSVLLWRHCDTLCTSGLWMTVMFVRNGPYGLWRLAMRGYRRCDTGAKSDAYECLNFVYHATTHQPSGGCHVSGAGAEAVEFALTAHTYFCDSRSPLRSRSSQFFHTRAPLRSRSPDFWPAQLHLRSCSNMFQAAN